VIVPNQLLTFCPFPKVIGKVVPSLANVETIELVFPIPGHTKNSCDGAFGLVRRLYKRSRAFNAPEFFEGLAKSTPNSGMNIGVKGSDVTFFDFAAFFEPANADPPANFFAKSLPFGIKSYQRFVFQRGRPGMVGVAYDPDETKEQLTWFDIVAKQPVCRANFATALAQADPLVAIPRQPVNVITADRAKQLHDIVKTWKQPEINALQMTTFSEHAGLAPGPPLAAAVAEEAAPAVDTE